MRRTGSWPLLEGPTAHMASPGPLVLPSIRPVSSVYPDRILHANTVARLQQEANTLHPQGASDSVLSGLSCLLKFMPSGALAKPADPPLTETSLDSPEVLLQVMNHHESHTALIWTNKVSGRKPRTELENKEAPGTRLERVANLSDEISADLPTRWARVQGPLGIVLFKA